MKKIVAIIEAREASSRLPGKVLLPMLGKPMLARMVERLQHCYLLSDIVIATAYGCKKIIDLADQIGVGWWEGSEDDVLGRVLGAAHYYNADIIVELTGDCPLIDPAMVDKVVADYLLGGAAFVANSLEYTAPRGMDVRVFSRDALMTISFLCNDPVYNEHVSLYFWEHPQSFVCRNVRTDNCTIPDPGARFMESPCPYRLTVDTQEDYEVVKQIFEALYPKNPAFTLFDILHYLDNHIEVARINAHIQQKAVR